MSATAAKRNKIVPKIEDQSNSIIEFTTAPDQTRLSNISSDCQE